MPINSIANTLSVSATGIAGHIAEEYTDDIEDGFQSQIVNNNVRNRVADATHEMLVAQYAAVQALIAGNDIPGPNDHLARLELYG